MGKEDFARVQQLYGAGDKANINYASMSKDMGLHTGTLDFYHKSSERIRNVDRLRQMITDSQQHSEIKRQDLNSLIRAT